MPHAPRIAPGRTHTQEGLTLYNHYVGTSQAREVVGGARTHATAAYDYHISSVLHSIILAPLLLCAFLHYDYARHIFAVFATVIIISSGLIKSVLKATSGDERVGLE